MAKKISTLSTLLVCATVALAFTAACKKKPPTTTADARPPVSATPPMRAPAAPRVSGAEPGSVMAAPALKADRAPASRSPARVGARISSNTACSNRRPPATSGYGVQAAWPWSEST